jgi:Tfp pilus assembly protein FimT
MNKKKFGFTLVELLVGITIIMLLAVVGTVSLNNFNGRQKIISTKDDLITNLRLARNYATSMQMPSGLTGTLDYIRVSFSGSDMTISAVTVDLEEKNFLTKTILPEGIGLNIIPETTEINFDAYKGNYIGNGGIQIILASEEVGTTAVVKVNDSGLINEK